MKVKIKRKDANHRMDLEDGSRVKDALDSVEINKETVIVEREGEIVSMEEELVDGDELKLINVVSGG
ncbi:hypothetical protein AKJ51_02250 [candidate division MSBL1 archaeon SCGC-AAA382A20]|uniref:Thiamine biosynthesis protein ThiS n=1 Tax=candidate division MSBL1 archaeon SCGC-AAA382A20 TaxID=1698280 RepID=A0A133VKQ6_9EURY|nr:hypothetical protein AKJ51_02250 [candidate division MSBL1 archaeon SCGC-AAA382A20]